MKDACVFAAVVAVLATSACVGSVSTPGSSTGNQPAPTEMPGKNPRPPGTTPPGTTPPGTTPPGETPPSGGMMTPLAPGEVPMRRLTKEQYQSTIKDLLGVDFATAGRLSDDEYAAGFRSNGTVALKELQAEQYQQAAEEIAGKAVVDLATLVPCAGQADEAGCAATFITTFGKRAYRRPLTTAEVDRFKLVYEAGRKGTDFKTGIGLVVQAFLQSPNFLYRPELGEGAAANGAVALSSWEMASRLSYAMWNTMPDKDLFTAAEGNALKTAEQVSAQVMRMLSSDRARPMLMSFVEQWLDLGDMATLGRAQNPLFTTEVQKGLTEQMGRFFDGVVRQGDGRLGTLLTSRTVSMNGPLRALYNLPAGEAGWHMAELPASERAGIMTLAPLMAVNSHAEQTSLVRRGYMVRVKFLCTVPPPPPANVNSQPPMVDPNSTARVRFEQHRENPTCANCHSLMDPLGSPFEVYDPIGKHRKMDGKQPVDSTGELTGTATQDGKVNNPLELVAKLGAADEVRACVAKQFFRYAMGRAETDADAGALRTVIEGFRAADHKVPELLRLIASTPEFRQRPAFTPAN
jgi:Protein of unknown function (DUF1592)/Protein of unknown function (DUF1588)/Protein of unknown function (DUF1595)/Protein of unknown function (DUF1587)/Protein of unknown function (DUF1585)